MISDYMGRVGSQWAEGVGGMQPTFDVWGIVLAPSESTKDGNVRVKAKTMKDGMDTFENVPVLTGYGGEDHGAFFLPEEGDTVRLTFLGGDFKHPIVTGSRFPEEAEFVKKSAEKNNLAKAWKMKNGSGIAFGGEKGKETIEVSGSEKMAWRLSEEAQETMFGDQEKKNQVSVSKKDGKVQLTAENSICLTCGNSTLELKKDGSIVLSCEQLSVKAKKIKLEGSAKVELEGQEISIKATTGLAISGKGQVKVESTGQLNLSGAIIKLNG